MKYLKLVLLNLYFLFFSLSLHAQDEQWNLVLETDVARFIGYQVFETDSFYYVVGTSIALISVHRNKGFQYQRWIKDKARL